MKDSVVCNICIVAHYMDVPWCTCHADSIWLNKEQREGIELLSGFGDSGESLGSGEMDTTESNIVLSSWGTHSYHLGNSR